MNNKSEKYQYIFILGAGRSGTKFLRDILDASDKVAIIPYDVGYVWRYGNENLNHDQLTPEMLNKKTIKFIKKILPKLVKKYNSKSKPSILIEKSVPNTLRPAFINEIYPNAKFIHLIRDGRSVTESSLRLWKTPPERKYLLNKIKYFPVENYKYAIGYIYNRFKKKISSDKFVPIWGPRYVGIHDDLKEQPLETVCARQWKQCVVISLSQLQNISKDQILEVRYEDLMSDTNKLKSICEFIGVSDIEKVTSYYEKNVNRSNLEKWKSNLSEHQKQIINTEINTLNRKLGYK